MRFIHLRVVPFLTLCVLSRIACDAQTPPRDKVPVEKTRPLPEVPSGDQKFSNYTPAHPYVEIVPGVLSRTVFEAAGPPGYRVEVRDLRIGPGKKVPNISLPGAVFLEVRYGGGAIVIGAKRQELQLGSTASISEGQSFELDSGEQPLTIRAYLLRSE